MRCVRWALLVVLTASMAVLCDRGQPVAAEEKLPPPAEKNKTDKKSNPAEKKESTQEYVVADDAKITYDGKKIKLSELPKDAYLRLWVDEDNPKLIVEIEASSQPFPDDEDDDKGKTKKEKDDKDDKKKGKKDDRS